MPDESDEALFDLYRAGSIEPLRTLIERHRDELYRFLFRLLGDHAAADDVFQDTFFQIHQSAQSFDSSRRFKPWLFTIAANKGRDYLRKKRRHSALDLAAPVAGSAEPGGATFADLLPGAGPAPGDRSDASERGEQVQRALNDLPPALREVLVLAYFQRLSYSQMAEQLGIPLGTVKSRLHSAVASFAKRWGIRFGDDPGGGKGER